MEKDHGQEGDSEKVEELFKKKKKSVEFESGDYEK